MNKLSIFILTAAFTAIAPTSLALADDLGPDPVTITGDEVWSAVNSPVLIRADLTVAQGGSLSIEPGVEVQLAPGVGIFIDGQLTVTGRDDDKVSFSTVGLDAQPTSCDKTNFTSNCQNMLGNCTNLLHNGLTIRDGATVHMAHFSIVDATQAINITSEDQADISISKGVIERTVGHAIRTTAARSSARSVEIKQTSIRNTRCGDGIRLLGGTAFVQDVTIQDTLGCTRDCTINGEDEDGNAIHIDDLNDSQTSITVDHITVHNTIPSRSICGGVEIKKRDLNEQSVSLTNSIFSEVGMVCTNGPFEHDNNLAVGTQNAQRIADRIEDPMFRNADDGDLQVVCGSEAARPIFDNLPADTALGASLHFDRGAPDSDVRDTCFDEGANNGILRGHLFENKTLDDETYILVGDLIVEHGRELSVAPGTRIQFVAGDERRGGADPNRAEIIVQGDLNLGNDVTFEPFGIGDDWYGVRLETSADVAFEDTLFMGDSHTPISVNAFPRHAEGLDPQYRPGLLNIDGVNFQGCGEGAIMDEARPAGWETIPLDNERSSRVTVTQSNFRGAACHIRLLDGVHTIRQNIIEGVSGDAIGLTFVRRFGTEALIDKNTIYRPGGDGIDFRTLTNNNLRVTNNNIIHNGGNSVTARRGVRCTTNNSRTINTLGAVLAFNNIWDFNQPASGRLDVAGCRLEGTTNMSVNPLLVNEEAGLGALFERDNFEPFDRSPLVNEDANGDTIGAVEHQGSTIDDGQLFGRLTSDTTLSGDVDVTGDVFVPRGITLTIEPGTRVIVSGADRMQSCSEGLQRTGNQFGCLFNNNRGGTKRARVEIVVDGRLIAQGGNGQGRITFEADDGQAHWEGVVLREDATSAHQIANVDFHNARHSLESRVQGRHALVIRDSSFHSIYDSVLLRGQGPYLVEGNLIVGGRRGIAAFSADRASSPLEFVAKRNVVVGQRDRSNDPKALDAFSIGAFTNHPDSSVLIDHNTIHVTENNVDGIFGERLQRDAGFVVTNNSVGDRAGIAFRGANNLALRPDIRHNNVFNVTNATGTVEILNRTQLALEPRYAAPSVDPQSKEDFRLREESPLRNRGERDTDIGALEFFTNGCASDLDCDPDQHCHINEAPSLCRSTELAGFIYEDRIFGDDVFEQNVRITGDIIIPEGVAVTILPGTTFEIADTDLLRGGLDPDRIEIIVMGELSVGGVGEPAVLRKAGGGSEAESWVGVRVLESGRLTTFKNVLMQNSRAGLQLMAAGKAIVEDSTFEFNGAAATAHGADGQLEFVFRNNLVRHQSRSNAMGVGIKTPKSGLDIDVANNHFLGTSFDEDGYVNNRILATFLNNVMINVRDEGIRADNLLNTDSLVVRQNTFHNVGQINGRSTFHAQSDQNTDVEFVNNVVSATLNASRPLIKSEGANLDARHNVVWDQTSPDRRSNVALDATNLDYSPLYLVEDPQSFEDVEPTHRSPARFLGEFGFDMGAVNHDGALTEGLRGFLHEDLRLEAEIEHEVNGDLVVLPGRRLLISPGATIFFQAQTDTMAGGEQRDKSEIHVAGSLVIERAPGAERTVFQSFNALNGTPRASDWGGIVVAPDAEETKIANLDLLHAHRGVSFAGVEGGLVEDVLFSQCGELCVELREGAGVTFVNRNRFLNEGNRGVGIRARNRRAVILNNLATGCNTAIDVEARTSTANHVVAHNTVHSNRFGLRAGRVADSDLIVANNNFTENNTTFTQVALDQPPVKLRDAQVVGNNVFGDSLNLASAVLTLDASNLNVDPLYIDAANGNFLLNGEQDGGVVDLGLSFDALPLEDADALRLLRRDIDGRPRPLGRNINDPAIPDIGAFEFASGEVLIPQAFVPDTLVAGTSATVQVTGQGFGEDLDAITVTDGGNLTFDVTVASRDALEMNVTADLDAITGPRDLTFERDGQIVEVAGAITVISQPTINDVACTSGQPLCTTPTQLVRENTVNLVLDGERLENGATVLIDGGVGVSILNQTITAPSRIALTLQIASVATLGARTVTVINPDGGNTTVPDAFEVVAQFPAPTLISAAPSQIPVGDTTRVVLRGTNFQDQPNIPLVEALPGAGLALTNFQFIDNQTLEFDVVASVNAPLGANDLRLTNPDGQRALLPAALDVTSPVSITEITPDVLLRGAQLTSLTVTGTGFVPGATFEFLQGGLPTTDVAVDGAPVFVSSTLYQLFITVDLLAQLGDYDLLLSQPNGDATLASAVEVISPEAPELNAVNPGVVPLGVAGQVLTVTGRNITDTIEAVTFSGPEGDVLINDVTFVSTNQLNLAVDISPRALVGTRDLTVSFRSHGDVTLNNALTVQDRVEITEIDPAEIVQGRQGEFTLTGAGLAFLAEPGVTLAFDNPDVSIGELTVVDEQTVTLTLTADEETSLGSTALRVNFRGAPVFTLPGAMNVLPAVSVTGFTPASLRPGQTSSASLEGTGLDEGMTFQIDGGGVVVESHLFDGDAQSISANLTVSLGAITGLRDVVLLTPGGFPVLFPGLFEVLPCPILSAVEPAELEVGSIGNEVLLSGEGFADGDLFELLNPNFTLASVRVTDSTQAIATIDVSDAATNGELSGLRHLSAIGECAPLDYPGLLNAFEPAFCDLNPTDCACPDNNNPACPPPAFCTINPLAPPCTQACLVDPTLPFCDQACELDDTQVFCDPCFQNPSPQCSQTSCAPPNNPASPLCVSQCAVNPNLAHCADACAINPGFLFCDVCLINPNDPVCLITGAISPTLLVFNVQEGGQPDSQQVAVTSQGGALSWEAAANDPRITLGDNAPDPQRIDGVTNSTFNVTLDASGLTPADSPYLTSFFVELEGEGLTEVEVVLNIAPLTPGQTPKNLIVSPRVINVTLPAGAAMAPEVFNLSTSDGSELPFLAVARHPDLSITPDAGTTSGFVSALVDTTTLEARRAPYIFPIGFSGPDFDNDAIDAQLRVRVIDPSEFRVIVQSPESIMGVEEGSTESVSTAHQVRVSNGLVEAFSVSLNDPSDTWLSVENATSQTPGSFRLVADPTGLAIEDSPLRSSVTVTTAVGSAVVPVTLHIGALPPTVCANSACNDETLITDPTFLGLDGRASASNPPGHVLSHTWSLRAAPEGVDTDTLLDAEQEFARFPAMSAGEYVFDLRVTDEDNGLSNVASFLVQVREVAPTADAGQDLAYLIEGDSLDLTLFGERSRDGNGDRIEHVWRQVSGPEVNIADFEAVNPTVKVTETGRYVFEVLVTDPDGDLSADQVALTVQRAGDTVPTALVTQDEVVEFFSDNAAQLDGSPSVDPDGDALRFQWSQVSGPVGAFSNPNDAVTTFVSSAPGLVVAQLVVSDGVHTSAPRHVSIRLDEVADRVPTAVISAEQQAALIDGRFLSDILELDGTASFNGNGEGIDLNFFWSQREGGETDLRPLEDLAVWRFAPLFEATYRAELTVSDSRGPGPVAGAWVVLHGAEDSHVPLVNDFGVEGDARPTVGSLITLVSQDETDIDGDALTYRWVQVDGPVVGLDDPTAQRASFRPQIEGTYRFALRLDDGTSIGPPLVCGSDDACPEGLDCVKGECVVETEVEPLNNQTPIADAGNDQVLRFQSPAVEVTLDGTGSIDPDDRPNPLTFFWSLRSGPVSVDIAEETSATPSVTLPIGGTYVFALQVSDGLAVSAVDTVEISLVGGGVNEAPIADAGDNLVVAFEDTVTLDGSASSDPDGDELFFEWVQLEGPQVALDDQDQTLTSFTAPGRQLMLSFQLTVRDAFGGVDTDEVTIKVVRDTSVENLAPTADAGENQTVEADDVVTLDGSASSDPNGDALLFLWTQTAGPGSVSIEGADTATPTFTARIGGTYTFELVVSDGLLDSEPDTVTVEVIGAFNDTDVPGAGVPGAPDGGCDCSVGQGSPSQSAWWLLLGLTLWALRARRRD